MLHPIGIDIVSVARIERALRRPRFVERVLTARERDHCRTAQQVAGRWAAKEAVCKCLGCVLPMTAIEVTPGPDGAPEVLVEGRSIYQGHRIAVSISHEREFAAAVAVLEREPAAQ
ncbi:MAG TPA: holo-ACP synthase [Fimbriimonadaceae bacterium]|nr:holo-ACP synthase [Fimbriimonadaceae bacterium]